MRSEHTRSFTPPEPLHLRDDGRSVFGLIVPWNTPSDVVERNAQGESVSFTEDFQPGSFTAMSQIAAKRGNWGFIGLKLEHEDSLESRIGFATDIEHEGTTGAFGTFKLYEGPQLEKVRSMIAESHQGLSIEFVDMAKPKVEGTTVHRTQVFVRHVAATPVPVYADAGVLAMRAEADLPIVPTPGLDEVLAYLKGEES